MQGPIPKVEYKVNQWKHVSMIAGGTGITPMLQVMNEIARNPQDKTKVTLLFANVTEKDILCRSEIDKLCAEKPEQFKAYYILDRPPPNWQGGAGYVTQVCTNTATKLAEHSREL